MQSQRRDWNLDIDYLTGGVRIRLWPVRKAGRLIVSGGTLLATQALSAVAVAFWWKLITSVLHTGRIDAVQAFFLLLFTFGFLASLLEGVICAYIFAWQIGGQELLEINAWLLRSTKTVFTLGATRAYTKEGIAGITLVEQASSLGSLFRRLSWMKSGRLMGQILVTGTGGTKEYVGFGIDHEQGIELLEIIREHLYPINDS